MDILKDMKEIKTNYGTLLFKSVIVPDQFKNLIEGTEFYYDNGEYIGFVAELFINDEILDKDNLPELYDYEDFFLQQQRVNETLAEII